MTQECIPILCELSSRSPKHSFNLAASIPCSGGGGSPKIKKCSDYFCLGFVVAGLQNIGPAFTLDFWLAICNCNIWDLYVYFAFCLAVCKLWGRSADCKIAGSQECGKAHA